MSPRLFFRRRQFIIKKGLQFRYIGLVFVLALLASIVTGYTVFITGWTLLGEKLANVYPQGRLIYVIKATNLTLIRNLLLISPLIFVLGLLFSHRIAGPVYRIEKSVYDIAKGNLALRISLRRGDELWDLADVINTMTENFDKGICSNKEMSLEIRKDLDAIKQIVSTQPYNPSELQSRLDSLSAKIANLDSSLNKWTTTT